MRRDGGRIVGKDAMTKARRRVVAGGRETTLGGLGSWLSDWCAEETEHQRDIAEAAPAQGVGNAVGRAYRRGDALKKRGR